MNHRHPIARWLTAAAAFVCSASILAPPASAETWKRIGRGGFDGPYHRIQQDPSAICVFKGKLHVGTGEGSTAEVWSYDGKKWTQVWKPTVADLRITGVGSLVVFGENLYASGQYSNGSCGVWRTNGAGGSLYKWARVSSPSDVGNSHNSYITSMASAQGYLYVGTYSWRGCEVWRYNGTAWSQAIGQGSPGTPTGPGFGDKNNYSASAMAVSPAGDIHVGTAKSKGAEVWCWNGSQLTKLNYPGFGKSNNYEITVLAFYKSSLYAVTRNYHPSCQVWKYLGPNPSNWTAVSLNGCGDQNNTRAEGAAVFGSPACLYLSFNNYESGCRIMRYNGTKWERANTNGFSDPTTWGGGPLLVFGGRLYAGAGSDSGGRIYATSGGKKLPHDWTLKNDPGFTMNANETASSSAFFQGNLYIGTSNAQGCEIWRRQGTKWKRVAEKGFGNKNNVGASAMAADAGALYIGTYNYEEGCQVWRYNGTTWAQVNRAGFKDPNTREATSMIIFGGKLYVGTESYQRRARIWRFDGPGPAHWTKMNNDGFGVSHTIGAVSMAVFNNKLYVGTYDSNDPCRVWRYDGPGRANWTAVSQEGFGTETNRGAFGLCVYKGKLYAGTYNAQMTGAEIWRYNGSGTNWTKASQDGFGNAKNSLVNQLMVFSNLLYSAASNWTTGGEIWSYDGSSWLKSNKGGFGNLKNGEVKTLATDGASLFAGTDNSWQGCEVWVTGSGAAAWSAAEDDEDSPAAVGDRPIDLTRLLRPRR